MQREVKLPVTVIVGRSPAKSAWLTEVWRPGAVLMGTVGGEVGSLVRENAGTRHYWAGTTEILLHAKETEAYLHNLESAAAAVFVVMRPAADGPLPLALHRVTVSPYEAQDYADGSDEVVERLPMPTDLGTAVAAFIDHHHVEEPFYKRKRGPGEAETPQFGKEPIFLTHKQRQRGDWHG